MRDTPMDQALATGFGRLGGAGMRASDADREAVAARLRRVHVDGRLDADEFGQRLDRCLSAKTVGELDALVADLPPAEPHRAARFGWSRRTGRLMVVLPVLVALVAGVSVFTGVHAFFLVLPLFFFARGGFGRCLTTRRSSRIARPPARVLGFERSLPRLVRLADSAD